MTDLIHRIGHAGADEQRLETKAYREEQLAAAFFIAAALFFNAGWPIAGWLLIGKAILDSVAALLAWGRVHEARLAGGDDGK